jgi:hypothetical protein
MNNFREPVEKLKDVKYRVRHAGLTTFAISEAYFLNKKV